MNNKKIAEKLKELRGSKPREVVAENIGVSLSALAMYETGERVPRDEIKKKIAGYFGKTVQEIFFDE